jgi:POLQ-like helicase
MCKYQQAEKFVGNCRPVFIKEYIQTENLIKELYKPEERSKSRLFVKTKIITKSNLVSNKIAHKTDLGYLCSLVTDVIPNNSCLVFCSSKINCESVAKFLSNEMPSSLLQWKKEDKEKLASTIRVWAVG